MKLLLYIMVLCSIFNEATAQQADAIKGVWLRADKQNYKVEIYQCGELYCGKLVWLKEPNDENGQPRKDLKNPDKSKRANLLVGTDVLRDFKFKDGNWIEGQVYSFNRGKYYDAIIQHTGETLQLTVSILFFTRNYTWIKSP